MQGLITLDLGNSNPHLGIFLKRDTKWDLAQVAPLEKLEESLKTHGLSPHNAQIAISKVKTYQDLEKDLFEKGFLMTSTLDYWRGGKFFGLPVHYSQTIGQDRLIQAFYTFRRKLPPTLLIDAGTFSTIDVINQDGFIGGYIIPSFESYFSLFKDGDNLQNYTAHFKPQDEIPQSTEEALVGGYSAFNLLIENLIEKYHIQHIILTGGKSKIWEKLLEASPINQEIQPNYIHWSLFHWWTTQIELL